MKHLTATSPIGDNIFNPAAETPGKTKDIMIDIYDARIACVIVGFGGFLGIKKIHSLDEAKESLTNYPGFDKEPWPGTDSHGTYSPGVIAKGLCRATKNRIPSVND